MSNEVMFQVIVTLYKVTDEGGKLVSEKVGQKPLVQNLLNTNVGFVSFTAFTQHT
jgi:hypothetical protein